MMPASRMIWLARRSVSSCVNTGLTPQQAETLSNNLLAVHAVVMDQEEEIQLLQQQLNACARRVPIDASGDNVVHLPMRLRIANNGPDGGDAA